LEFEKEKRKTRINGRMAIVFFTHHPIANSLQLFLIRSKGSVKGQVLIFENI